VDLDDTQGLDSLKRCLHAAHATQVAFARLMGASPQQMSMWLSGARPIPSLAIRAAYLAAAMSGVPLRMPHPARYLAGAVRAASKDSRLS
jgi:DNA-binding transcriptional regulator YdaS (Cro superfamily)